MTDMFVELKPSVEVAARQVHTRWRRWADLEDVIQAVWLWLVANLAAVRGLEPADLVKRLRNAAERYCRKEKAAKAGYDPADEYHYSFGKLKSLLPDVFDPEATPSREPYRDDEQYSEWVTEVADVRAAVRKRTFPLGCYTTLREYATTGRELDDEVRAAIWALQRQLGGGKPR